MNMNTVAMSAKELAEENKVACITAQKERNELSTQVAVLTEKMGNTIESLDKNTKVTLQLINTIVKNNGN